MVPITFSQKNKNENLILMVHGFTGGIGTWINEDKVSFQELLLKDDLIKSTFDIANFEYYTKLITSEKAQNAKNLLRLFMKKNTTTKKNLNIKTLSEFMRDSIQTYCSEYQNIIIIAHSMGGLITKNYIINELSEGTCKVSLFLSLAVPHKGSDWANIGKKLKLNNPQVEDLAPLSDTLDEITHKWIKLQQKTPKTVYYYGQYDTIVTRKSAIAYQSEKVISVGCDNDHFNIVKPKSTETMICKNICLQLQKYISENNMRNIPFEDKGQLDNELFVLKLLIADVHNKLVFDSKKYFFEAEYIIKELLKNGYSKGELEKLYEKLESLYNIYFVQYTSGILKSSDQLVSTIYERIILENDKFLKISSDVLDATNKTGMLNQLANKYEHDIWWAKNNNIKTLEEFRKAKCKDGA